MKKLILLAALFSTSTFAYVTGDKILFQTESTFVSSVFNKSLCLNGETYEAMITKCLEWRRSDDDRVCTRYGKIFAIQPMESTRKRCARYSGGDDDRCTEWETVSFIQSPDRTVKWYRDNDDSQPYKIETVTVPECN